MVTKFPKFSQALAQDPATRRIWYGLATAHDFESHDGMTEENLYQKIFASHFGQLAIIFLWTSGNLFHVAWQGNFEQWVADPIHVRPIAHAIWDPHFGESAIKAFSKGNAYPVNITFSGLYQWWYGNTTENFGEGLLVYGSRDTGRFAEYKITVEKEDGKDWIFYQGNCPNTTAKTNSGISIQSICEQYQYILDCMENNILPERDYDLIYSDEKIDLLYSRGQLNKTETAQYEKRKAQIEEGKDRINKQVEKGDWQCDLCQYRKFCYDDTGAPRK